MGEEAGCGACSPLGMVPAGPEGHKAFQVLVLASSEVWYKALPHRLLSKGELSMLWDTRKRTGERAGEGAPVGGQGRPPWLASGRWSSVQTSKGQRLTVPLSGQRGPCRRVGPAQAQPGNRPLHRTGLPSDLSCLSWDHLPLLFLTLREPVFLGEEPDGWQRGRTRAWLRGPCYLP